MQATCTEISWEGLDQHQRSLRSYLIRRCRDQNEVDDVAQETLLRAARFRARLVDPGNLRAWLLRIASSVLKDHVRRERRMPRMEGADGLFERCEGRELEPGECEDEALLFIEGQFVLRENLIDELHSALSEVDGHDRDVLSGFYGATLCRECDSGASPSEGPVAPRKEQLFRARRRLYRKLTTRVRCVVTCGDELCPSSSALSNTGWGTGASPENHVHGAPRALRG